MNHSRALRAAQKANVFPPMRQLCRRPFWARVRGQNGLRETVVMPGSAAAVSANREARQGFSPPATERRSLRSSKPRFARACNASALAPLVCAVATDARMPDGPFAQFAFPEFTTTARIRLRRPKCFWQSRTGEAFSRLCVKIPAAATGCP